MPNTLEQLNGFSNTSLTYQDQRAYAISFNPSSPVNQSVSIVEGASFVSTAGIDITGMISTPRNMRFRVDLSSLSYAAYVDWGTLPAGVVEEIPGTNIFDLVGVFDDVVWNEIKAPTITAPDQATNFSYTSTLTYPDPANTANDLTKSWTTSVTVTATPDLSTPTDWNYVKNSPGTIAGTPQIIQTGAGTFTLTVTPSLTAAVSSMSSSGSGGSSSFNAITKVLTLTGTYTQINSHLNNIVLTTPLNYQNDFTLTYFQTRPSGATASVIQNIYPVEPYAVGTATFAEDTPFALQYSILDESATATSFTVSVAQTIPDVANTPGYFTVNGSNVGSTWSISNTKANINAANVWYFPPTDWSSDLQFSVNQSKVDSGNTVVQATNSPVTIFISSVNNEIVNMIGRTYTSNTVNNIFASQTPQIQDGPDIGQTYTITLSSALGKFGNSVANALSSNTYSFTGNKTSTNAQFSSMVFVPNYGSTTSGTFTYTQNRGNVSQVNSSLSLTVNNQPFTPVTYTFTGSSTWTPTSNELLFGNIKIACVGGGGGGAGAGGNDGPLITIKGTGGGGGAGGEVKSAYYNPLSNALPQTTYNITIGAGGAGNIANTTSVVSAGSGGTSTISSNITGTLLSSLGGQGGIANPANTTASRGGNVSTKIGGLGAYGFSGGQGNAWLGGGGASYGSNGNNASFIVSPPKGGNGAPGVTAFGSTYGGGGGGGGGYYSLSTSVASGGIGGGGAGNGTPGSTGGGGGGATWYAKAGGNGNGGNGIVVIKIT